MLRITRRPDGPESGQAAITLAVVLVAVVISAFLLLRTMNAAVSINKKAETVRDTAGGINTATDSIRELVETNELATSILNTAEALGAQEEDGRVPTIVNLAQSIDSLATSINATATTINTTARNINTEAVDILDTARKINEDVRLINQGLDTTIPIARNIKADTGAIVGYADQIHSTLARIPLIGGDGH